MAAIGAQRGVVAQQQVAVGLARAAAPHALYHLPATKSVRLREDDLTAARADKTVDAAQHEHAIAVLECRRHAGATNLEAAEAQHGGGNDRPAQRRCGPGSIL